MSVLLSSLQSKISFDCIMTLYHAYFRKMAILCLLMLTLKMKEKQNFRHLVLFYLKKGKKNPKKNCEVCEVYKDIVKT